MDFDTTGQLLIIYCAYGQILGKKWEYNEAVHQLFINFRKACVSGGWSCIIISLSLASQ